MGRIEDNKKVLEIWKDVKVNGSKSFDEAECKLLAQQNAILVDISRSLAVIDDEIALKNNIMTFNDIDIRSYSNERSGSDDGEEKGL